MRIVYNAALAPLGVASWVYGIWPRATPAAAAERDQRLGRALPALPGGGVWLHGASAGEARLVAALARGLRTRRPSTPVAVSAVTTAGRALLPGPPDAEGAFFLPLDLAGVQRRAFDAIRPALVVLVETELWPNLLWEAAARGVPVALVNARLSPDRWGRYLRLRSIYGPLVGSLAVVLTSSPLEADRFMALGASASRVVTTGNLKYDLPAPTVGAPALRLRFGIDEDRPVVVAGSTGQGEDPIVLDAFLAARRDAPRLLLVLAPRHRERFAAAADEASRRGLRVHLLSSGADAAAGACDVLLADVIGELAELYALGVASFVGGSLAPIGGHNLLEPLAAGSPPLFGPHTGHVAGIAELLCVSGAGERVADGGALARAWVRLTGDRLERARRVAVGRTIVDANRGALARTLDRLEGLLDHPAASRGEVSR